MQYIKHMDQDSAQYKLRLPAELKQQIEASAKDANRSMNADIVARLQDSFNNESRDMLRSVHALEAVLLRNSSLSTRRTEVSQRLRQLLEQVNQVRRGRPFQPSHIAQAIGIEYAEIVENWFAGKLEPSFSQLASIATYLGCNITWLQHGDMPRFPTQYSRIPEFAEEGVTWLLDLEHPDERPTNIYFIRSESQSGELLVIKQYGEWRCKIYRTPYHVSEEIGNGGESSLSHLLMIWQLLYRIYVKTSDLLVQSFLVSPEEFTLLLEGNEHPLKVLQYHTASPWWEDIWDQSMFTKSDYWDGWEQLCTRMQRALEVRPHLLAMVEQLKAESHPFINQAKLLYKKEFIYTEPSI